MELYLFIKLQCECISGCKQDGNMQESSYVYQLGFKARYIGQGAVERKRGITSGSIGRFKEHWKAWKTVQSGGKVETPQRHKALLAGDGRQFLHVCFLAVVPKTKVLGVEAALIAYARTEANFLPNVKGNVGKCRDTPRQRTRASSWKRRRICDVQSAVVC